MSDLMTQLLVNQVCGAAPSSSKVKGVLRNMPV